MCIIIAKPAGVKLPLNEIYDNCCTTNRDGIGFAYNLPGQVPRISKGYHNVKELVIGLKEYDIADDHNLLVHFRLATHGKVQEGNCHPFPLTNDYQDMKLLNCECGCAIAHNGVFSGMPSSQEHSDTMKFVGGVLASPEIINNISSKSVKELIRGYCGFSSKLAFLKESGFTLIGDFELSEGINYSNKQYEGWGRKNNIGRTWNGKGWDDVEDDGLRWCYQHNKKDNCRWCTDHTAYDTCWISKDIILLPKNRSYARTCEWCNKEGDNVYYNTEIKSSLCEECSSTIGSYNDYGSS